MKVYIQTNDKNKITSYNFIENPMSDDIEIDIDVENELSVNLLDYYYIDDKLVKDDAGLLENAKETKKEELNNACNEAILDGFSYAINGEKYKFSFDTEAQFNFQGAERLLSQGVVDEITWTVKQDDEYKRVSINAETMNQIMIVIFQHKANNISKYRDVLLPMVERATTVEEVESVTWDSIKMSFEN